MMMIIVLLCMLLIDQHVEYTKWFGLGISAPSKRHKTVFGEFPLITISLFKSSPFPVTPAKFCTCLAGSPKEAAYKLASSIFKERALTDENSLTVSSFFLPPTTITSSNFSKSSINPIFKTTSLPGDRFRSGVPVVGIDVVLGCSVLGVDRIRQVLNVVAVDVHVAGHGDAAVFLEDLALQRGHVGGGLVGCRLRCQSGRDT